MISTQLIAAWPMADLADGRERYLKGEPAPEGVRPVVLASWERCRCHGVDPVRLRAQSPDSERLAAARRRSRRLIESADAFLDLMGETLVEQPHLVALADVDATILSVRTGPGLPENLEEANLFAGASWTEAAIGCNGVGTCLATGESVILIGPEHFQAAYVGWTCIGVPIRDADGGIVGALDLSVPNECTHAHAWGWALSVARGIEASLARGTPPARSEAARVVTDIEAPLNSIRGVFDFLATRLELGATHSRFLEEARSRVGELETELTDILHRLAASESESRRAVEEAQRALKARDAVLAIVSHDLRNPLTTVVMASSVLEQQADDERKLRPAAAIRISAEQMLRLVDDLLDAARIEEGGLRIQPETCLASELVDAAVHAMATVAESRRLVLLAETSTDREVTADRGRILQVFSNLISNAVAHTGGGRSIIVSADDDEESGGVRFAVSDNGSGIDPEDLPHIFDRFWQARVSRRAGAGLGLAIARGIVERHGGRISVVSEPGCGATFHFTLPAAGSSDLTRSDRRTSALTARTGPARSRNPPRASILR